MPYYPYQPSNARFSGGANRRSEHDNHATKPAVTAAYLIEHACIIDKDSSNIAEKIATLAETIQNARTPQVRRLIEEAISRAANNISKTAKMDTRPPAPDWNFYAERLLIAKREDLMRELASATADLQMTRGR